MTKKQSENNIYIFSIVAVVAIIGIATLGFYGDTNEYTEYDFSDEESVAQEGSNLVGEAYYTMSDVRFRAKGSGGKKCGERGACDQGEDCVNGYCVRK